MAGDCCAGDTVAGDCCAGDTVAGDAAGELPLMTTGVLALQGAFEAHERVLWALGEECVQVRTAAALGKIDRLIIPGGESSTMSMLAERGGILEPMRAAINGGMPTLGTCAGAILLASRIIDGRAGQKCLGAIEMTVRRNGYGRQLASFEDSIGIQLGKVTTELLNTELFNTERRKTEPFNAVFIRAPLIESVAVDVEVLAVERGAPVMVRSGTVLATTFHPELSGDDRIHQLFLEQ